MLIPSSRSIYAKTGTFSMFLFWLFKLSTACRQLVIPRKLRGICFRLQTKPSRVFRPQAKKQSSPFSPAACPSGKTLLSPEVFELSFSQAPCQLASVQKHESSFTSLLVLSISKQIALKWIRKTEGTKSQLSPRLAEAEWSEFRLTQCAHRAASPPSAKSLGLCPQLVAPDCCPGRRCRSISR